MNRTLVCLSSLVRHFDVFWPTFKHYVLSRLRGPVDLVAHFPPPGPPSEEVRLRERLSAAVERCQVVFAADPALPVRHLGFTRYMSKQRGGVRGNLLQWHSMRCVADLMCEAEEQWGPYDRVIWSRPDLLFLHPVEETPPTGAIAIPAVENWYGYHDRFCDAPPALMNRRLRIYDYFLERWYPTVLRRRRPVPHRWLGRLRSGWNPESVLRDYLDRDMGIPVGRTQVLTARVRRVGSGYAILVPRWAPRHGDAAIDPEVAALLTRLKELGPAPRHDLALVPLRRVILALPELECLAHLVE